MSRATPGPSMRRGTFEEGGRTKEEGDVICGVWSVECGMEPHPLTPSPKGEGESVAREML
ncbi:MAG: hypothetical protein IK148_04035 [Prevotella sp.]|nr:hypothetical protein [Prevotella sp.]